jgi:hypothetical protein
LNPDLLIGLAATAVPAYVIGYLMLNKNMPVFRMYLAMIALGLGYLYFTGGLEDIGATFGRHVKETPAAAVYAPAAKPAAPPPAAETPKAETAPAPAAGEPKPAQ